MSSSFSSISICLVAYVCSLNVYAQNYTHPDISPSGNRILFTSDRSGNKEIFCMDLDGSNLRQLTFSKGTSTRASWSPDESQIVFDSDRDGDFEIYLMNLETQQTRQLTSNSYLDMFGSFSPKGNEIAFHSDRDRNREIYSMNINGENLNNLTNLPSRDGVPSWSPDGTEIIFHSTRTGYLHFQLFKLNKPTLAQERLTRTDFPEEHGSWSPDGKSIAYYREDSARSRPAEIYLMTSAGAHPRKLTSHLDFKEIGEYSPPVWFPDSKKLAFWGKRQEDEFSTIFFLDIDSGIHTPLVIEKQN